MAFDLGREIALETARQLERLGVWDNTALEIPWFLRKRQIDLPFSGSFDDGEQWCEIDLKKLPHE